MSSDRVASLACDYSTSEREAMMIVAAEAQVEATDRLAGAVEALAPLLAPAPENDTDDSFALRITEPGRYPGEARFEFEEYDDGSMHLAIATENDARDAAPVVLSIDGAKQLRDWLTRTILRAEARDAGG